MLRARSKTVSTGAAKQRDQLERGHAARILRRLATRQPVSRARVDRPFLFAHDFGLGAPRAAHPYRIVSGRGLRIGHYSSCMTTLDDRNAITSLRMTYGHALDARDWALFESIFTEEVDADFSAWGIPAKRIPRSALVELMKPAFRRADMRSQQVYANIDIELRADAALVRSSLVGYHHLPELAPSADFTLHATYHDRVIRTEAGWKIAAVRLEVVFMTGNPAVLQ